MCASMSLCGRAWLAARRRMRASRAMIRVARPVMWRRGAITYVLREGCGTVGVVVAMAMAPADTTIVVIRAAGAARTTSSVWCGGTFVCV